MTALILAHILQTALILGSAFAVLFWQVHIVRLDIYRQKLFVLRDSLFDYALAGNICFDDPAYRLLRDHMNGLIRHGHQLTIFRVILSMIISSLVDAGPRRSWHDAWTVALGQVADENVRNQMIRFEEDAISHAAKHLILGSPTLLVLIALAMVYFGLSQATKASMHGLRQLASSTSKQILRRPLDYLEDDALCA